MRRQLLFSFLAIPIFLSAVAVAKASPTLVPKIGSPAKSSTSKEAALQGAMRKLWEDHITWTRVFIISTAGDLPDKATATERLLQNQVDIGNAVKPYYGDAAGDKLTTLLKEHITTAAEVVAAAKMNDKAKLDDANKRWFANADQIADFLSSANPKNWPAGEMRSMMHDHLDLTTKEVVARLHGDWASQPLQQL